MRASMRDCHAPDRSSVDASSEGGWCGDSKVREDGNHSRRVRPDAREAGCRRHPTGWGVFHAAAVDEDGKIRVFEVWDSREQAEAWAEKAMAARTEAGFGDGPPAIEYLEVHKLFQR